MKTALGALALTTFLLRYRAASGTARTGLSLDPT